MAKKEGRPFDKLRKNGVLNMHERIKGLAS
jgi:hypothetical protein